MSGKKQPHRISARIDQFSYFLKVAIDNINEWRGAEAVHAMPPSLFNAAVVYATLLSSELNRVTMGDLRKVYEGSKAGTLEVDLCYLTVSVAGKGVF